MREQRHPSTLFFEGISTVKKDRSECEYINISKQLRQGIINRKVFRIVPLRQVFMKGMRSPFDQVWNVAYGNQRA